MTKQILIGDGLLSSNKNLKKQNKGLLNKN
jgi:hypothetical protein